MDPDLLVEAFNSIKARFIFGFEVAPTTGTPHLEGYVEFATKCRPKEKMPKWPGIHWDKMKGTEQDCITYCTKDGNYRTNMIIPKPPRDVMEGKPYPWQDKVLGYLQETPDDRKIHWIYDPEGNNGKTALARHLFLKHKALYVNGKAKDALYAIAAKVEAKEAVPIVVFDFTRSQEGFISYEAIEAIKNGIFFSAKYESKGVCIDPPHVLVLANFHPIMEKLTMDRWEINTIMDKDLK